MIIYMRSLQYKDNFCAPPPNTPVTNAPVTIMIKGSNSNNNMNNMKTITAIWNAASMMDAAVTWLAVNWVAVDRAIY